MIEKAIAFIQAQPDRITTSALLHNALQMTDIEAPSKVLAEGLKDGRLVKEGKFWTLGSDAPAPAVLIGAQEEPAQADAQENPPTCEIAQVDKLAEQAVAPELGALIKKSTEVIAARPVAPRGKTKIQTAIDYLKEHGKTDTHTLRGVLGIKSKSAHPLSYLQDALGDGRIKRSGNSWWVDGCQHVNHPPISEIPAFVPEEARSVAEKPPAVAETTAAVSETADPVAALASAETMEVQTTILDDEPVSVQLVNKADERLLAEVRQFLEDQAFSCALWSNGLLEMRRGETTLARLTPAEVRHMSEFLGKVTL